MTCVNRADDSFIRLPQGYANAVVGPIARIHFPLQAIQYEGSPLCAACSNLKRVIVVKYNQKMYPTPFLFYSTLRNVLIADKAYGHLLMELSEVLGRWIEQAQQYAQTR